LDLESISNLSLRLCFQPQRYKAPDRVSSGQGFVARRCDPRINRGKLGGVPSLADLNTFSRRGRAAPFLWYHTCLCHKPWYHRRKPRGSANLRPGAGIVLSLPLTRRDSGSASAGAIPKQKDRPKAVSPIYLASQALRISHSSAAPSNQSTECH
jgi:hypothetical protein